MISSLIFKHFSLKSPVKPGANLLHSVFLLLYSDALLLITVNASRLRGLTKFHAGMARGISK